MLRLTALLKQMEGRYIHGVCSSFLRVCCGQIFSYANLTTYYRCSINGHNSNYHCTVISHKTLDARSCYVSSLRWLQCRKLREHLWRTSALEWPSALSMHWSVRACLSRWPGPCRSRQGHRVKGQCQRSRLTVPLCCGRGHRDRSAPSLPGLYSNACHPYSSVFASHGCTNISMFFSRSCK